MQSQTNQQHTNGNSPAGEEDPADEGFALTDAPQWASMANGDLADWLDYEDTLFKLQAAYQADESTQRTVYVKAVEQNEVNYVGADVSDYVSSDLSYSVGELNTILGDDLSASVGGSTSGTSAADASAANDLAQFNTTAGDEVTFETTLSPDAQAYQDTVAQDAHDAQWAEAQAAHDLATGVIDAATAAAETSAAAATQAADDEAAASLYQSRVGGAAIVQVKSDADAALTDATLTAGLARQASDADASSIETYSEQESAAYENEVERNAAALAQRQSSDAFDWYTDTDFYYGGGPYSAASTYPSALLLEAEAQAQAGLVRGGPGPNGTSYGWGTAVIQQNLTDALAQDQANQEQEDAGAQYTRDLAADLDQYNLSVGEAQAAHDAQYAIAASDQALVDAGAFPASLPGTSTSPDDGTPILASANYNQLETIGGYSIGPTTATSTSLVGSMFSVGPDMGAPYGGWTGWGGWTAADAPPAPLNPANNSNNNPTDGAAPPEAPEILSFVDAGSEADDGDGQPPADAQLPPTALPAGGAGGSMDRASRAAANEPGPSNGVIQIAQAVAAKEAQQAQQIQKSGNGKTLVVEFLGHKFKYNGPVTLPNGAIINVDVDFDDGTNGFSLLNRGIDAAAGAAAVVGQRLKKADADAKKAAAALVNEQMVPFTGGGGPGALNDVEGYISGTLIPQIKDLGEHDTVRVIILGYSHGSENAIKAVTRIAQEVNEDGRQLNLELFLILEDAIDPGPIIQSANPLVNGQRLGASAYNGPKRTKKVSPEGVCELLGGRRSGHSWQLHSRPGQQQGRQG